MLKPMLVSCIIFAFLQTSKAQDYVVLTTGDSVLGSIRILNEFASCKRVVMDLTNGDVARFKAREVKEYYRTFEGGADLYIQSEVQPYNISWTGLNLLRVVVDGQIKLLEHTYKSNSTYGGFYARPGFETKGGYKHIDYYITALGFPEKVKPGDFNTIMSQRFFGNRILSKLILEKKVDYYELESIVKIFNADTAILDSLPGFDIGSVILEDGTKINGFAKRLSRHMSCLHIVFVDIRGQAYDLAKEEVKAYTRGSDKFLKRKLSWSKGEYHDTTVFVKIIQDGPVRLVEHVKPGIASEKNLSDFRSDLVDGTFDQTDYYVESRGELFDINSSNFAEKLASELSNHPSISSKIEKKKLRISKLKKLLAEYNDYTQSTAPSN